MIAVPVVPISTVEELVTLASKSYWSGTGLVRVVCRHCGQFQHASGEILKVYQEFQCVRCGATNDHMFMIPDPAFTVPCGLMSIVFYRN